MLAQKSKRIHVVACTSGYLVADSEQFKALIAAAEADFSQAGKVADYLSEFFFTNTTPEFGAANTFELDPYPSDHLMEAVLDALTERGWETEEDRCRCRTCKDSSIGTIFMRPPAGD